MNKLKYRALLLFLMISSHLYSQPGWLDVTFGSSGKVTIVSATHSCLVKSVSLQPDGKLLLGMTTSDNTGDYFGACRLFENGDPDRSFGFNGFASISPGSITCQYADGLPQPDGKFILAGSCSVNNNYNFAVARLKENGKADSAFGGAGYVVIPVGTANDDARSVAIQEDGKLVVAGTAYNPLTLKNDFAVVRLLANGSLDTGFGNNGKVVISAGNNCYDGCNALLIQPDGKILTGGGACLNDQDGSALIRFLPNGSLDPAFGMNGIFVGNRGSRILDLALQSDGKILECGYNYQDGHNYQTVARYKPNGSPDTTFGDNGMVVTPFNPEYSNYALSIAEEPDGHILTGGYTFTGSTGLNPPVSFTLFSYNTDGTLNENFGDSGMVLTSFTNFEDFGMDFSFDDLNRIVFAGQAVQGISSNPGIAVARYYSDLYTGQIPAERTELTGKPYPNPADGVINLRLPNTGGRRITVNLFDLSGTLVSRLYSGVGSGPSVKKLSLQLPSQVSPGLYILNVACDSHSEFYKIVIQTATTR